MNMRAYEGDILLTRVGMFYEVSTKYSAKLQRKIHFREMFCMISAANPSRTIHCGDPSSGCITVMR
jgi:hypothetical protein